MDYDLEALILANAHDDDIEFIILNNIVGEHVLLPQNEEFNLENMSEADVKVNFRFSKQDIPTLARALRLPDFIRTNTRNSVSGVMALCILLRRLAYPSRLKDLQLLFNLSPQSLSQIINYMVAFISENHADHLTDLRNVPWLNEGRMEMYAEAVRIRGGAVQNCWGFIDGTTRAICRPTVNQEDYYSGHKRQHCLKYQSIMCPDGIIINLKGAYIGRRHDAGIFRESNIYNELEAVATFGNRNYVLYGDQAYPISNLLLCPYPNRQGLPQHQQAFNNSMKVIRTAVEWGFQKVLAQFAFLDFKKNQKLLLQDLQDMYKVGVVLNNCHTCLYGSQTTRFFGVVPPTLENYLQMQ